jgi:DNA-binding NtrC family response regulator
MLKPTVVIVDDDEDNVFVLQAALEVAGFEVKVARSVKEARTVLDGERVDALVSDYSLGDGDAVDLMTALGAKRPRVAVLVTGHSTPEHVARSRAAGFDAHLVKPIALDQLERVLFAGLGSHPESVREPTSSEPPEVA